MRDLPLQEFITAHIDTTASNQLEELLFLLRFLLLRGSGLVSQERLATALRQSRSEVEALLPSSGLVVAPSGHLHLSPGRTRST
jgi:hypothetical protein